MYFVFRTLILLFVYNLLFMSIVLLIFDTNIIEISYLYFNPYWLILILPIINIIVYYLGEVLSILYMFEMEGADFLINFSNFNLILVSFIILILSIFVDLPYLINFGMENTKLLIFIVTSYIFFGIIWIVFKNKFLYEETKINFYTLLYLLLFPLYFYYVLYFLINMKIIELIELSERNS